jgi:hypothetical protein
MALQKMRERGDREALMARFRENRSRLRLIRSEAKRSPEPRVVAEVLSDGTIREMDGIKAWDTKSEDGFHQGSVVGNGWTLWWEHRPWTAKTA